MGAAHPSAAGAARPDPAQIFQSINAYQQSAALRAAIELDVFTAIGEGRQTPAELAERCQASERGVRILCDYLTVAGLLGKQDGGYRLTTDSAMFLDRSSPAYLGSVVHFLQSPELRKAFDDLTTAVRQGSTAMDGQGSLEPESPRWVEFARHMAPMMQPPADWIAGMVEQGSVPGKPLRVLDIAAGHGLFGISIASRLPQAQIVALDWANVLEVARENAAKRGVADRYRTIAGDAFGAEFGSGYDLVLLTNFLHHFDLPTNTTFLKKVRAALRPGGRAITLEFIPNEDRVSPPMPATFPLIMLAMTPHGDAYTFAQYQRLFADGGFAGLELKTHPVLPQQVLIART